jgi:hypothetical protein
LPTHLVADCRIATGVRIASVVRITPIIVAVHCQSGISCCCARPPRLAQDRHVFPVHGAQCYP